jgi:hypothetical protein
MSFNENNYSVNYLIWDQETIQRDNAERKNVTPKRGQMGQKNMELMSAGERAIAGFRSRWK